MTITPLDNSAALLRADTARMSQIAQSAQGARDMKRIEEAAKEFEAMFLSEMLKPMFEGLEVNELFGGGKGEEIFKDFLITEYGKKMSNAGGIGLAKFVQDELIRQQEGQVR
jgi:Rod binding domain-containing protein